MNLSIFCRMLSVLLLLALMSACERQTARNKADQLLADVNVLLSQEEEAVKTVPMKYRDVFGRESLQRALAEREKLRGPATEMVNYLSASASRYREIANKFGEVSRLPLEARLKEYAAAQARLFTKDAEYRVLSKERISLALDESIKDEKMLVAKLDHVDERIRQIHSERARLQTLSDAFANRP